MSHSHIRIPKPLPRRNSWTEAALLALFAILAALSVVCKTHDWSADMQYSTAEGSILETRIVVDHTSESSHGGQIFYRTEARTRFAVNGQEQMRWLTVSEATATPELLAAKLSSSPARCEVYWAPGHPEIAKCRLE